MAVKVECGFDDGQPHSVLSNTAPGVASTECTYAIRVGTLAVSALRSRVSVKRAGREI